MLNVGFDISGLDPNFKAHANRGIGRYVKNLYTGFQNNKEYKNQLNIDYFDYKLFLNNSLLEKAIDYMPYGQMTLKQQVIYPIKLKSKVTEKFDILHFPAHMDAPSWSSKPYAVTVLDLIPFIMKELYLPDRPSYGFWFARWLEKRAIKNADLILAISQKTASDVEKILQVPEKNIKVTHLGVDEKFFNFNEEVDDKAIRKKYGLSKDAPIILYVGGIDQRKNVKGLLTLISNLKIYALENKLIPPELLISGSIQSDLQFTKLQKLVDDLNIKEQVFYPGFIQDEDLLPLYDIASFFSFLSFYEGFGLPPLEAMARGLPVLASNTSCMPEILEAGACLVNPNNDDKIFELAVKLLYKKEFSLDYIEKGRRQAAKYSWDNTLSKTLNAYESLL